MFRDHKEETRDIKTKNKDMSHFLARLSPVSSPTCAERSSLSLKLIVNLLKTNVLCHAALGVLGQLSQLCSPASSLSSSSSENSPLGLSSPSWKNY